MCTPSQRAVVCCETVRSADAEWTVEGERKGNEYASRRMNSVIKQDICSMSEWTHSVKQGGTAGVFLSRHGTGFFISVPNIL